MFQIKSEMFRKKKLMKIFSPKKVRICASWENLADLLLGFCLFATQLPKLKFKKVILRRHQRIYINYLNINSLCIAEMKGHPQQ